MRPARVNVFATSLLLLAAAAEGSAGGLRLPMSDIAPWAYRDGNCQPTGIAIDLLRDVERRTGLPIRFIDVPYAEQSARLLDGGLDGDLNERSPWFDQHLLPIAILFALEDALLVRASLADRGIQSGLKVGHVRTHTSRAQVLNDLDMQVIEFEDYGELARAFVEQRIDGAAGIKETLLFHLYRQGATAEVLHTLRSLQTPPVWLYLSPKIEPAARRQLQAALAPAQLAAPLAAARRIHLTLHRIHSAKLAADCAIGGETAP